MSRPTQFVDRTSHMRDDVGDLTHLVQHRASGNVSKWTGATLAPVNATTGIKVNEKGESVPDDEALKQLFLDRGVYVTLKKD